MESKIIIFYKKILEKKFNKKKEYGYDSRDVDEFLDGILKFLKIIDFEMKDLENKNQKLIDENIFLKNNLIKKESENAILESRINDILKDGYYSHQMRKEISELKRKVNGK